MPDVPVSNEITLSVERQGPVLTFKDDAEAAMGLRIIEAWEGRLKTLHEIAEHGIENGKAVQEYGGWNYIEGRLRQLAAMEISQWHSCLSMEGGTRDIDIAMFKAEAILAKLDGLKDEIEEKEKTDESIREAMAATPEPVDPGKLRANAEKRLAKQRARLAEIEASPCTQENIDRRWDTLRNIRQAEATLKAQIREDEWRQRVLQTAGVPDEQPERDLKVRVVAYEGQIVICPIDYDQGINDAWWPTGGGKMGCVVGDSKQMLGVSKEAIELMHSVTLNRDAIGDLGWWRCDDGTYAFSWFGAIFRMVDPNSSEAARDFRVHDGQYIEIENTLPDDVKAQVDEALALDLTAWREPFRIEPDPYKNEDGEDDQ